MCGLNLLEINFAGFYRYGHPMKLGVFHSNLVKSFLIGVGPVTDKERKGHDEETREARCLTVASSASLLIAQSSHSSSAEASYNGAPADYRKRSLPMTRAL